MRYAVGAGLCGLLLGLVHTYDVLSLGAVWLVYVIVLTMRRNTDGAPKLLTGWLQALVAGALTAPSVLYIYHELTSEAVFRARAEVKTLTPFPAWVLLGYGFIVLLAAGASILLFRTGRVREKDAVPAVHAAWITEPGTGILLVIWAIVNFGVAYLPTAIQRKLLQGEHFPIAILAGIGAAWLLSRFRQGSPGWNSVFAASILTFVLSLTNVLFVQREITNYTSNRAQTQMQRTYLQAGEIEALEWIRDHSRPTDGVQPLPWIALTSDRKVATSEETVACFTPGLIDRRVYCGHWGETPDFGGKLKILRDVELNTTPDSVRRDLLQSMKVRYLLFSQKSARDASSDATEFADRALPIFRGQAPLPPYLQLVHSNEDADVYEVSPAQ
jgi:hypothetical protein